LKFRRSREPIYCYSDGLSEVTDKKTNEDWTDTALDLIGAINELENPRQRAVMQLSLRGCNYQEIAERLTGESGPTGGKTTYEMVRGAFEKAREILKKRLKLSPLA
jgi:DNA-directed RNA polymerase specialized sigma24 family protein